MKDVKSRPPAPIPPQEEVNAQYYELRRRDHKYASSKLLLDVEDFLRRFVAYPSEHALVAHVLWCAHTHAIDAFESTPRLAFLSPEPASGKTRALEVTELLVQRPVESVNATAAYLFRKVADQPKPTILYDEIDTIFGPKAKEHEEVRGLINAGHRRGAKAGRCAVYGKTVVTEELEAFAAVALAGIGNLPDTILTRSLIIRMRRRAPTEHIEPYRRREHSTVGYMLRDRLAAWVRSHHQELEDARPAMPPGLVDRAADLWEPLLAIADAAGCDWPSRARAAAVALVAAAKNDTPSLGIRLLTDLRRVFGQKECLYTGTILNKLTTLDEAPWDDLRGKPLDSRGLSRLLSQYEISSRDVREEGGANRKGYRRIDLHDAWMRYLPSDVADVADAMETKAEEQEVF